MWYICIMIRMKANEFILVHAHRELCSTTRSLRSRYHSKLLIYLKFLVGFTSTGDIQCIAGSVSSLPVTLPILSLPVIYRTN